MRKLFTERTQHPCREYAQCIIERSFKLLKVVFHSLVFVRLWLLVRYEQDWVRFKIAFSLLFHFTFVEVSSGCVRIQDFFYIFLHFVEETFSQFLIVLTRLKANCARVIYPVV